MTQRQYSIRIGLDGKAEITRDFDDIAQKGEGAFSSVQDTVDRATGALGNFRKSAQDSATVFAQGGAVAGRSDFDAQIARLKAEQDALTSAQKQLQISSASQTNFNRFMGIDQPNTGSAAESARAFQTQFDQLDEIAAAKAQQIGQNFQSTLNTAMGIGTPVKSAKDSAGVFEDEAKAMQALDERAALLKAQIDPLGAAQARLNSQLQNANELLAAGKITTAEHTVATTQAQRTYDVAAKSLKGMSNEARLNSFQISNLTFQINDVISGLAMGQKPLSVLTQQGGQIIQVFAGTGMGVVGALKATAETIRSFLTPTVLLGGAIAAVGATTAYVLYNNWQASRQFQAATEGLGRATGATAGELAIIAHRATEAGAASLSSARDTETAFAKTGTVGKENLQDLIALTDHYYRVSDQSMDKARETMVGAFQDPAKAGLDLLAKLGGLDDKTAQYIKTLVAEGERTKAQKVLQDALTAAMKDTTEKGFGLGDAFHYVANSWAEFFDGFRPKSVAEKIGEMQAEIDAARKLAPKDVPGLEAQLRDLQAQNPEEARRAAAERARQDAQNLSNQAGPVVRSAVPGYQELQDLTTGSELLDKLTSNAQAMKLLGVTTDQARQAQDSLTRAKQTYLDPAERAASADMLEIQALGHFTVAERAADAARRTRLELSGKVVTAAEVERQVQSASTKVYAEAAREIAAQTIELDRNARSSLATGNAYLVSAAAGQTAEARAKALAEALRDGVNVETRTRQLLAEQVAQDYAAGAKQISQLGEHATAQKTVNDALASGKTTVADANQQMQIEIALANLRVAKALALAQGYTAEANALQKIIDKLPAAFANDNAETRRNQALRTVSGQNDQIEIAKREIELQGASESAREVELAQLRAKQQLLQQGIDLGSDEGKQIVANAGEIERLNQQLQLATASRGELESTFDSVSSRWSDFIVQGKYDWESFAKAGLSAMQDIESEIIKLGAINPLKNLLFGEKNPTLDSVGGIIGDILGNGKSTTAAAASSGTWISAAESWLAGLFHEGGMAEAANSNRALPANVLRFAPRLHAGAYLGPDEVPAILQTGERVLNRAQTRDYNAGGSRPMQVNQYIQTTSPRAFQASKGQVMSSLVRGMRAAAARM